MRIAILSDIHGNLSALQAVLAEVDRQGVDLIVNAGDTLSGPLASAQTADLLMHRDIPMIAGNHERQLLTLPTDRMNPSDACTYAQLSPHHWAWLASAPPTQWLTDGVFICHGTPESDLHYWLETVTPDFDPAGSPGVRQALPAEVLSRLGQGEHVDKARLVVCGHTHVPRVASIRVPARGDCITVVNPGSVGLPAYADTHPWRHHMQTSSPHARYALAEWRTSGWQIDLRAVPYDFSGMAELARSRGRADWASALETGWAP